MAYDDSITIQRYNEVFFRIDCNYEQAVGLKNALSCYAPKYLFSPRYKAKMWDGKISFFDMRTALLPIGLVDELRTFAFRNDYELKYGFEKSEMVDRIKEEEMEAFYAHVFSHTKFYPRDYQHDAIYAALKRRRGVIEAATGCHASGTMVVMSTGLYKAVDDVCVGDKLLGIDGNVRNVVRLYSGSEMMYKISPRMRGSDGSFVVNENHILHLTKTKRCIHDDVANVNISVKDYIQTDKWFKHMHKLRYNDTPLPLKYKNYNGPLSPYFVGLYLGDGHTYSCSVTSMDSVIHDYVTLEANRHGCITKIKQNSKSKAYTTNILKTTNKRSNPVIDMFSDMGLVFSNNRSVDRTTCENKFIPDCLKYSNVDDRLQLLAGIIDTDGHLSNGTNFDVCMKSEKIIDDIIFIARSLGFVSTKKVKYNKKYNKNYFRCSIQGDIWRIPVKIEYKKPIIHDKQKRHNVFGFDVTPIGVGDFFGFELDGDHLYFTKDFCVHHNSGKSMMIYTIIRRALEATDGNILLVVPNIALVNQMFSDFKEYGWDSCDENTCVLYGKTRDRYDSTKRILISTWQSIYKKEGEFFEQFEAIIVDEVHGVNQESNALRTILSNCVNARYRIGLTGTLPEFPADLKNIVGYIGPRISQVGTQELIERGVLSKIIIRNVLIRYSDDEIKKRRKMNYAEEIKFITEHQKRNKVLGFIIKNINRDENSIILCERISHLKSMYAYLTEKFPDRKVVMIHGNVDANEREAIRKNIDSECGTIIVATYGTMSTGVNIKKIHNVFLASSYKSMIKIYQTIGRGLRTHEDKKLLTVWDLVDDFRWTKRTGNIGENYVFTHFKERMVLYKKQNFNCITKTINIHTVKD